MTCDARQMFVTFTHEHIFKALDKTKIDSADAAALIGEIIFQKIGESKIFLLNFKIKWLFIARICFYEIIFSEDLYRKIYSFRNLFIKFRVL